MERLQKELKARDAKVAQQAEDISGLRVELSELGLNAQVAIDDLREDLQKSEERLKLSQVQQQYISSSTPVLLHCLWAVYAFPGRDLSNP